MKIYYTIPYPYTTEDDFNLEVYGEGDMGWYEWRVVKAGRVQKDSKDRGYGSAPAALRAGLNFILGDDDA